MQRPQQPNSSNFIAAIITQYPTDTTALYLLASQTSSTTPIILSDPNIGFGWDWNRVCGLCGKSFTSSVYSENRSRQHISRRLIQNEN